MAFWDDWLKGRIQGQIDELLKADGDKLPDKPENNHDADEQIGRKAIIDDPFYEHVSQHVMYKHKLSRLSNKTLKDVSIRDWLISAIIQCRLDTMVRFSRTSHDKFKEGMRFVKRDKSEWTPEERAEIAALEDFIYNCGRTENVPADDRMLFGEFVKLIVRDALTFGHVAVEKIKTRSGGMHRFRPIPAESVYLINKKQNREVLEREIQTSKKLYKPGDNDPRRDQEVNEVPIDYYKYVQTSYDMRIIAAFGDEDMIWKLFNPQNFVDSMGYCYSPLELAIINVTNHLNVENYNANFFTHGYAARGVLHLKGTVTQSQLTAFRRQFYNTISGAQHAWRTPIIAGIDEVQWVPLAANAKEMEYINFNNHILRAICAQFQIDPIEIGLDYLASANGRGAAAAQSNQAKIEYSRERGLYPLFMFIEDLVNCDIIPAISPELASKYKFEFTGYSDETPQTQVAQLQAEMTVHSSMNDLLKAAQKDSIKEPGADLPLNAAYWALIEKNLTRGEIRERFFGDKGAASRKELQYIPADPAFMGWQQLMITMDRQKQQDKMMQAQQQSEAQQQQIEHRHAEGQHQRDEEKHNMEMEMLRNQSAHEAVAQGNLKDTAKQVGAGSTPLHIGGTTIANPINKS